MRRRYRPGLGGVALRRAGAGLLGLDLAVLGRRGRDEVGEQPARGLGDLLDGAREGCFVGLRRLRRAADLADVLERCVPDLGLAGRRLEVVQRADVAAHTDIVRPGTVTLAANVCLMDMRKLTLLLLSVALIGVFGVAVVRADDRGGSGDDEHATACQTTSGSGGKAGDDHGGDRTATAADDEPGTEADDDVRG